MAQYKVLITGGPIQRAASGYCVASTRGAHESGLIGEGSKGTLDILMPYVAQVMARGASEILTPARHADYRDGMLA